VPCALVRLNRTHQKLHTQLREAYPSTATGAADPAWRSDAGLGAEALRAYVIRLRISYVQNDEALSRNLLMYMSKANLPISVH